MSLITYSEVEVETVETADVTVIQEVKGPKGDAGGEGAPGENVEIRVAEGFIQWKLEGDAVWENLIAVADLKGDTGEKGDPGDPTVHSEGTAGEDLSEKDLIRFHSDGKWYKTSASAGATAKGFIGISNNSALADAELTVILSGETALPGLTAGAEYFMSETAGEITAVLPVGEGKIVRFIGYALSTEELCFSPDKMYIELSE